jgi:hypothetical protein
MRYSKSRRVSAIRLSGFSIYLVSFLSIRFRNCLSELALKIEGSVEGVESIMSHELRVCRSAVSEM